MNDSLLVSENEVEHKTCHCKDNPSNSQEKEDNSDRRIYCQCHLYWHTIVKYTIWEGGGEVNERGGYSSTHTYIYTGIYQQFMSVAIQFYHFRTSFEHSASLHYYHC